jgi:hypothetical protein
MKNSYLRRLALLLVVPAVVACERAATPSVGVEIVSPRDNAETAPDVLVELRVSGARAVLADGSRKEGEGHHHLFVDVDPTHLDSIIPRTPGIFHLGTGGDTLRLTGLTPGAHRVIAVFAYGDHVPIQAVAADTVTFTVR